MTDREKPRILCISRSAFELQTLCSAIPAREYEVLRASTPEQGVAVCVAHKLAAVVLDSEFVTEGWSAVQTFKMVNPSLPVVLLGWHDPNGTPHGADVIADTYSTLLHKLDALLKRR